MVSWSANVRSKPRACEIKTAATPWYRLVPSILMVAPTGRTKLLMSLSTPICSSTLSMVTGRVAALELVEKASSWAGLILLRKVHGLYLVKVPTTRL